MISLHKEDSLQNCHSDVPYDTSLKFIYLVTYHTPLLSEFLGLSSQQNNDTWEVKERKMKGLQIIRLIFIYHAGSGSKLKAEYKG